MSTDRNKERSAKRQQIRDDAMARAEQQIAEVTRSGNCRRGWHAGAEHDGQQYGCTGGPFCWCECHDDPEPDVVEWAVQRPDVITTAHRSLTSALYTLSRLPGGVLVSRVKGVSDWAPAEVKEVSR